MRSIPLFALLAVSASAQVAPRAPTASDRVVLVAGALAGGVVTVPAGPFLLVGAGAGTYVASTALGLGPTVGGVLIDTAVGTAIGYGAFAGTLFVFTEVAGYPSDLGTGIFSVVTGLAVGSAAIGAAHGVRLALLRVDTVEVTPAALAAPTGERGVGMRVRVGL